MLYNHSHSLFLFSFSLYLLHPASLFLKTCFLKNSNKKPKTPCLQCIAFKDGDHEKNTYLQIHQWTSTLGTPPKTFAIPTRQLQFIRKRFFGNAPVRQCTEYKLCPHWIVQKYPLRYQQASVRQLGKIRGQPTVDCKTNGFLNFGFINGSNESSS